MSENSSSFIPPSDYDPILSQNTQANEFNTNMDDDYFVWNLEAQLEEAIRKSINLLDYGELITKEKAQTVKVLDLSNAQITDLSGIEEFSNLNNLNLNSNQFANEQLDHLSSLSKLSILKLENNNLSSLQNLQNLSQLQQLYLDDNCIEDISFLQESTQLECLSVNNNSIVSIEALGEMSQLRILYLDNNQISELKAIANLTKLERLSANGNQITQIDDFIYNLRNLEYLSLSNNQIQADRVRPLIKLRHLTELHLDNNQINDIRFLAVLKALKILTLVNNPIARFEPLKSLGNLEPLYKRFLGEGLEELEELGDGVNLEMVYIPGGKFEMGSPENEEGRQSDESPQHSVTVQSFAMSKYPITQAQYQVIMGNNPANFQGNDLPVENVNWDEAVEFCGKLSQKTGLTYRLPSEAEWEYACRGKTITPFYFGQTISTDQANYNGNYIYGNGSKGVYREKTTVVGSFPPNRFGLYDMHGNVWEWCADNWHDNYQGAPSDGSIWEEGGNDKTKILRGGCWVSSPDSCRSASRLGSSRGSRYISVGFRVVLVLARTT